MKSCACINKDRQCRVGIFQSDSLRGNIMTTVLVPQWYWPSLSVQRAVQHACVHLATLLPPPLPLKTPPVPAGTDLQVYLIIHCA